MAEMDIEASADTPVAAHAQAPIVHAHTINNDSVIDGGCHLLKFKKLYVLHVCIVTCVGRSWKPVVIIQQITYRRWTAQTRRRWLDPSQSLHFDLN